MSVGLIIILNLLTIPFVYEAETLGSAKNDFPRPIEILKLTNCLKARWFYGYLVVLFLFVVLWLAPSRSGSTHLASYNLIGLILLIQTIVWGVVIYRILKQKGVKKNGS